MMIEVDLIGWPSERRTEREILELFGRLGRATACNPWHTAAAARVTFADLESAKRAVDTMNGMTPQGGYEPLEVRLARDAACKKCDELQRENAVLRTKLGLRERNPTPPRRARTPPLSQGPASPRSETGGRRKDFPPLSESADTAERNAEPDHRTFIRSVRSNLGDRAAVHVGTILPRGVRDMLSKKCDQALVFSGVAWIVPDRRNYVSSLRISTDIPGVLSTFFEWNGFRLVFFVDSLEFDSDACCRLFLSDDFCEKFGKFNFPNRVMHKM